MPEERTQAQETPTRELTAIRRYRRYGFAVLVLFGGSFGVWASTAPLAGAVIAPGQFAVAGSVKKVQHLSGGTIADILVSNGDQVTEGQVVLRLDATMARANLGIVDSQLETLVMRAARLRAERDGLASIEVPADMIARASEASVQALLLSERRLLAARVEAREGQKAQLTERIDQIEAQIQGLSRQNQAKSREIALIAAELDGMRKLYEQNLVPLNRLNELERNAARIDGERGQLEATIAELRGKIAETRLQILSLDQVASADASKELREVESAVIEYRERQVAARDQLAKIDIRAPLAGLVHQLAVHTVGGVVGPGETLMMIVPKDTALTIEAKLAATDIDSVTLGQTAAVRLPGLDHSKTPDLVATITTIGADLVQDETQRIAYYPIQLTLDQGEADRLPGVRLVPGMPAEAFITTKSRTFLDYLVEPLSNRLGRAMREG
ncbi:MAG: HlyD family type I secretion periplasmic adaptor subunit [Labrys sp. (in: a-proteobacteria)]